MFASSASVYGDPEKLPMHEDDQLRPAHAVLHQQARRRGPARLLPAHASGLSWIALRFFNVYGPGQKTTAYYTSVINHFVNRLRNGQAPVIDGKGEQSMDFIHVARHRPRRRRWRWSAEQDNLPINIGTGIDTSIAQLAQILIDAVGADVEPQFNPRDVLVARRAADITRAKEVLGWEPTHHGRARA